MRSILIVKTSAIGDVIHTFPVLDYLRDKFPSAQIDWVVEKGIAHLVQAHPKISHVLTIDSKSWRRSLFSGNTLRAMKESYVGLRKTHYDLLVDLQGNSKSALVTASALASVKVGYSWNCVREKTNVLATQIRFSVNRQLNVREQYLNLVQQYFQDQKRFQHSGIELTLSSNERARLEYIVQQITQPCLMVAFGSKWSNKQLSLSTWQIFLNRVTNHYPFSFVIVYASQEEKEMAERLQVKRSIVVGEMSLPLWQALMTNMAGVLTVDSAALHLCATTNTPSFSVFGPTSAQLFKPLEQHHGTFQGKCPYNQPWTRICPQLRTCKTGACLKEIDQEALYASFQEWTRSFLYL